MCYAFVLLMLCVHKTNDSNMRDLEITLLHCV